MGRATDGAQRAEPNARRAARGCPAGRTSVMIASIHDDASSPDAERRENVPSQTLRCQKPPARLYGQPDLLRLEPCAAKARDRSERDERDAVFSSILRLPSVKISPWPNECKICHRSVRARHEAAPTSAGQGEYFEDVLYHDHPSVFRSTSDVRCSLLP